MDSAFKIVCAWCNAVMRPAGLPDAPVNHSICDGCFSEHFDAARQVNLRRRRANQTAQSSKRPIRGAL